MFAKRLKELRNENQISQTELATALNISNRTISMYEQGNSEPNADILSKIANYFDVTTDYLIGITNSKKPANRVISDELNLSDEAIDILKELPLTVAYENGISLSDVLNAMITNPKFKKLLRSILLHISRNQFDWERFCDFITQHVPGETNLDEAKRLSQAAITDEFNSLLSELP